MKREVPVLLLAMLYPTVLAYLYFVVLARPVGGEEAGAIPAVRVVWLGGKALEFVMPLLWLRWHEGGWPQPARPTRRGLLLGMGMGLLVAAALLLLYYGLRDSSHFRETPRHVRQKLAEFGLASPAAFLAFAALLSVGHSLLEEYYWRWFVFGRWQRHVALAWAVLLSSGAFMAFHVIDLAMFFPGRFFSLALPLSVCVGIGGAMWCWIYRRSGSLYAPWLSHLLIDAALMAVGFDLGFIQT